jgi:hypothetical protein
MRLLQVGDSIVDGLNSNAIAAPEDKSNASLEDESSKPAPRTLIERTTVLGRVNVKQLSAASDSIFTGPVTVKETSEGYVRFSCLPQGSQVPMQYQCITDVPDIRDLFTSVVYGQPGYAQLGSRCPKEIKTGAENGSEMGGFNHLYQPRREACLKDALNQYFPYGLKPGVFYVN